MADLATAPAPAAIPAATPNASNAPEPNQNGVNKADVPDGKTAAQPADGKTADPNKVESVKKEANPDDPAKPYKLKMENGQEVSVSAEELHRIAQKGIGADKKFQEAHKIRKGVETFFRALKTSPIKILTDPSLGLNFEQLAQDYLYDKIKREQMTPQERELVDAKEKLAQAEQEKKEREDKENQTRQDVLVKHFSENYEKDIIGALQSSNLPRTQVTVQRVAYYLEQGLQRGIALKAADVTDFVRADLLRMVQDLFGAADGEVLSNFLGDGLLKKLNEAQLKKINNVNSAQPQIANENAVTPDNNGAPRKLSKYDWRRQMDEMYGK